MTSASKDKSQIPIGKLTGSIFRNTNHSKAPTSTMTVPVDRYRSEAIDIPPYISYVRVKENFLAENNKKLVVWPHFEDGNERTSDKLNAELKSWYTAGNPEVRPESVYRLQQVRTAKAYVMKWLEELQVSLDDIVDYLNNPVLYDKLEEKSKVAVSDLELHADTKIANAGIICAVFGKHFDFSMWQLARARYRELTEEQAKKSGTAEVEEPLLCSYCWQ